MRDCELVKSRIDEWLDGELDAPSIDRLNSHLLNCADCSRFVHRASEITADLERLGAAARRIASLDSLVPRRKHPILSGIRIAAAFVLSVGCLTAAYFGLRRSTSPPRSIPTTNAIAENAPRPAPSLAMTAENSHLTVRMESDDPTVHIYWVYDTVQLSDARSSPGAPPPETIH